MRVRCRSYKRGSVMRNKILIKVTALIMVLALTGCGNKANNTDSTTDTARRSFGKLVKNYEHTHVGLD